MPTRTLATCIFILAMASPATAPTPMRAASPPERQLVAVPHPDLSRLDNAVQAQLRESRGQLSLAETKGVPDETLGEAYTRMGKVYHSYELLEAAEACYQNAELLTPGNSDRLYYLGDVKEHQGQLDQAADYYERVAAVRPGDAAVFLRLGLVQLNLDHLEEAEKAFRRAIELDASSAAARAGLGKLALSRKQLRLAVEQLEAALSLQQDASSIHYPLALAYRGLGELDKANEHLQRNGPGQPKFADPLIEELKSLQRGASTHWLRGVQAFTKGQFDVAVAEFRTMVEADPLEPIARVDLGSTLLHTGDLDGAFAQFEKALQLDPRNARAHYNFGIALAHRRRDQEAAQHYEAAVNSDPGFTAARFHLANMLMRLRRDQEAIGHYQTVIEREPGNVFARFMTALALIRLNRHGDAKAFLETARSEFPNDADLSHALARLLAACPDDTMRDGKRALELLQGLWKGLTSVEFEYVETLAMALADAGRFEEAVRVQQDIIAKVESAGRRELVPQLQENLALYERHEVCRRPWRDDDPVFSPVPAIQAVAGPQPQGMSPAPR